MRKPKKKAKARKIIRHILRKKRPARKKPKEIIEFGRTELSVGQEHDEAPRRDVPEIE